jgi:predicted DsbA family dithiol-disulfide isomerase
LRGIEEEYGDRVVFEWRSFLLRPNPQEGRSLEEFVRYTESWRRPDAEEDAGDFRVWQTKNGPPSHSIPPHMMMKAARRLAGAEVAAKMSARLFAAYFTENLDITADATMKEIWQECGLDLALFEQTGDDALLQEILEEHRDAMKYGVTGVPAIMLVGTDVAVTGAHPRSVYRRWIDRTIAAREAEA